MIDWARVFNQLFEIIDGPEPLYFGGPRFIDTVQKIDPYFPDYGQYIEQRRESDESTTRKDYFYDILLSFEESRRVEIVNAILDQIRAHAPDRVAGIRAELGEIAAVPIPTINPEAWNAERLTRYLGNIDEAIAAGEYERAVTLAYTCLEGFLKAFVIQHEPEQAKEKEIIRLSRVVRDHLRQIQADYPDEALTMLNHIAHTIDRSRNRFSDAHFGEETGRWLAVFIRDLVNSEIRLLLHFL